MLNGGRRSAGPARAEQASRPAGDSQARPGSGAPGTGADERLRGRLHRLACSLALVTLAMLTQPGRLISDTKIDLAMTPAAFLGRAVELWDTAQFGQLQNQVAGYLFPMGPFFLLGRTAGLDGWVVQRLWTALLLVAAFLGAERLMAKLGVGTPRTRLIGALAYALAPRALTMAGVLSAEFQPAALLPWIMLPLVTAALGGNRVICAARSAFAVALCGGVNAAAVVAVLVVPGLYIVTRDASARRLRLLAWWGFGVATATLWWTFPLLLFSRYGFSFLPYTESAATTTAVTSLPNVLRGTPDWVSWIYTGAGPSQPVGFELATTPLLVVATCVVAALGLTGLLRGDLRERRFLALAVLAGTLIAVSGHISLLEPVFAGHVRDLLDGPLAPLRNLRKFDAVLRLPLAIGLTHLLATARGTAPARPAGVTLAALTALTVTVVPAVTLGMAATGSFRDLPDHWRQAASWLNDHAGQEGVLAVPGSRFGEYTWGRPLDEPSQQLLTVRWAQRQVAAAGSLGLVRLLDAIDQRLSTGYGSPGVAQVLARMGVRYLLVRNDLERRELTGAWPVRVHQALDASPGLTKVAGFGPPSGGGWSDDALDGLDQRYPSLEVYEVARAGPMVSLLPAGDLTRLYGGPEGLLALADHGLLGDGPVVLDDDAAGAPSRQVFVTDSLRRRERQFGELRVSMSPTLTAQERPRRAGAVDDYVEDDWKPYWATARHQGVAEISASSSASGPEAIRDLHVEGALPYAAVDGDPRTAWRSGGWGGATGQWLKVGFGRPLDVPEARVAFVDDPVLGPFPARVAVETDAGRLEQDVVATGAPQRLAVPEGRATWLRVRVLSVRGAPDAAGDGTSVAISELSVPGLLPSRTIVSPAVDVPDDGQVLTRAPEGAACAEGPVRWVCSPSLARPGEEGYGFDHEFTAAADATRTVSGYAVLRDPALVDRYTRPGGPPVVRGSSAWSGDPAVRPRSAFDGDPATTWVTSGEDTSPELTIAWKGRRTVSRLTVRRPPTARPPTSVIVTGAGGAVRGGWIGDDGVVEFPPLRTDRLTLRFTGPGSLQISEVVVPGVGPLPDLSSDRFTLRCGLGPTLLVNGTQLRSRAEGTFGDVLAGRPLRYVTCGPAHVVAGRNHVIVSPLDPFRVDSAVIAGPAAGRLPHTGTAVARDLTGITRTVDVTAPVASYLVVAENHNPGWRATAGGKVLEPVRIDGWRQGWAVPAGLSGRVTLTFTPDAPFRRVLVAGACGLVAVLFFASLPVVGCRRAEAGRRGGAGRATVLVVGGAAAGWWAGGLAGLVVVPLSAWLFTRGDPRRPARGVAGPRLWVPAAALIASGVALAYGRGPLFTDVLPQSLALPVLGALLAVLVRSGGAAPSGEAAAEQAERLLDREVGHHGDGHRDQADDRQHRPEPAGVRLDAERAAHERDHEHVPQEHAVGDTAEEGRHGGAEDPAHRA